MFCAATNLWIGPAAPLVFDPLIADAAARLTGTRGCGHPLQFDHKPLAIVARQWPQHAVVTGADGGLWCVRLQWCAEPPPPALPPVGRVIDTAAGAFHICVLYDTGAVYCLGASDACQFIPATKNASQWVRVQLPWRADGIFAHANITCVTAGAKVFCTGCTAGGCLCLTRTTLTATAPVAAVNVTSGGFCATGAGDPVCMGSMDPDNDPPRCLRRDAVVVCEGGSAPATNRWAAASRADYVVIVTDTGAQVSVNALRSIV